MPEFRAGGEEAAGGARQDSAGRPCREACEPGESPALGRGSCRKLMSKEGALLGRGHFSFVGGHMLGQSSWSQGGQLGGCGFA